MLAAEWLKPMLGSSFNFYLLGLVLLILARRGSRVLDCWASR